MSKTNGAKNGKRGRGRPSKYSEAVAVEILTRLQDGESLRSICESDHLPTAGCVCNWVVEDHAGFFERYTRARMVQAQRWAAEIVQIADDGENDTYVDENGNERTDHDVIARSRLRVDTRKWMLSKMLPKVYGDKGLLEITGAGGGPIQTQDMTDDEVNERVRLLENRLTAYGGISGNGKG